MVARAALILILAAASCGDDSTASSYSDLAVSGGADMGFSPVCTVAVKASAPFAPATLEATTFATLPGPISWTVTLAGASSPPAQTATSGGRGVSVEATAPGTYRFDVYFKGADPCHGFQSYDLPSPTGLTQTYRLRVLPPAGLQLAPTDNMLSLVGGTPLSDHSLTAQRGTSITGFLTGPSGAVVAGEIRFVGTHVPDADTRATSSGSFLVSVGGDDLYRPLLIPDSPALAPHLGDEAMGSSFSGQPFVVGSGAPVTGSVRAGANPIVGAGVVLRANLLPSGLGTSAADGSFSLRADPLPPTAPYQLAVSSDGWPTLTLEDVAVPTSGLGLDIVYTVPRVAVGGSVKSSAGAAVAGARVTIESADALTAAASVTYGGVAHAASGRVSRVVTSDAAGALPALQLPAGAYVVTVEPPAGASDGLTTFSMTAPGAWSLALQPPVKLTGSVTSAADGTAVAGARVTATALSGLGAAPSALTASDGTYRLFVGRGTASNLRVDPIASARLGDATLFVPAGSASADVALGPGLQVAGTVIGPNGAPLPSVLVEALCWSCASPTVLKTAVSDAAGQYSLYLPDPGQRPVGGDGGVAVDDGGI